MVVLFEGLFIVQKEIILSLIPPIPLHYTELNEVSQQFFSLNIHVILTMLHKAQLHKPQHISDVNTISMFLPSLVNLITDMMKYFSKLYK